MSAPQEHSAPRVGELLGDLESAYPLEWAEDWDRVGFAVGQRSAPVRRVLLAVDPTYAVARQAAEGGFDLLITHHPLLLRGINSVTSDTAKGRIVSELLRAETALWCGHTNVDRASAGTNPALAKAIGVQGELAPLLPPRGEAEGLHGLGGVGRLEKPQSVAELAARIAANVPATVQGVRYTGDPQRRVERVAFCSGAGDSFLEAAREAGVDAYITSDLRHHPAGEHIEEEGAPALIDLPHYASEWLWLPEAKRQLEALAKTRGWELTVEVSTLVTDPWSGSAGGHPDGVG
ncbi:Nif3-like dinuclear metal center hexameric protein [Dermabacteraceae bacterium CCM 9519]